MAPQLRRVEKSELEAFVVSATVSFLDLGNPDASHWARHLEPERTWVVTDDDRFVANCSVYTMDVTVPGRPGNPCPVVPMAGVTAVGVHPTHRRRGLLTQMMATMVADARRRGESVAGLTVSEGGIYGRFGFGVATTRTSVSIDPRRSHYAVPAPRLDLRLVGAEEARKIVPEFFERFRRQRPGESGRSTAWWDDICEDAPALRRGASGLYVAVADEGYVTWRAKEAQLLLFDLYGPTPAIEAALWQLVLDVDLVEEVVARRPPDDPLRWRLSDPRAWRVTAESDMLWVRVLDVPVALAARAYQESGRLVIEVTPPVGAPADVQTDPALGRFVLDAGPDGAECRSAASGEATDLSVDLDALGSVFLGGVRPSGVAGAGRVRERREGALLVADRLFPTNSAPFSGTGF